MNVFRSASIFCALGITIALAGPTHAQTATDVTCSLCVNTGDIANNAVRSSKINDGSVTSADIAKDAITGTHIISRAVTYNKLDIGVRRSLDNAISNLTTAAVEDATLGVAGADCPAGRIAVSASCACDDDNGNSNFGVLFACAIDGNGAIAACFDEAGTFNPVKERPLAIVQAICMGADTSDGTPWVPAAAGALAPSAGSNEEKWTPEAEAAWHRAQHERFVAALEAYRAKQAEHRSRMQAR